MTSGIYLGSRYPELVELELGHMIDKNVYEKAGELLEACSDAGLDPPVTSTYRSPLRQAWLLIRKTAGFLIWRKKPTEA